MKRSGTPLRRARRVVACVALAVLAASCGDDDDSSSATEAAATTGATAVSATTTTTAVAASGPTTSGSSTSPSGDVCADREAFRSSVAALVDVDVVAEGTNGLTAAVSAVKDDLAALRASAGSELQPDVDAVQDAIDQLETAISNFDSGGAAPAVTAVSNLASAGATLLDSLEEVTCGSSTT